MNIKSARIFRRRAYSLNFLLALEAALASFFNATYLTTHGVPEELIGLVYATSFAVGLVMLFFMPKILRHLGNRRTFIYASALGALFALTLALSSTTALIVSTFVCFSIILLSLRFSLDIFLESSSVDGATGLTRAIFLTISNSAFVVAPLFGGWLLADGNFNYLYETTACILLLTMIASSFAFRRFRDPIYEKISWRAVFAHLRRLRGLRKLFIIEFILLFSYSLEAIYLTIYLHNEIGFSLSEMGLIFAISLLPFPLLQIPLGILGDRWFGEKEILGVGIGILGLGLCALSFITSHEATTWALMLFLVGVGAAMVEVGTESHFFKHVDGRSVGLISVYRGLYPLAYIAAPILCSMALVYFDIQNLFVMFGVCALLFGIPAVLALKDTR